MNDENNNTLLVAAGIILIISWLNLSATRNLENRFSNLQGDLHSLQYRISHEIDRVSQTVWQIKEEERWWRLRGVEFLGTNLDTALVRVEWQVQEYSENSLVNLNYRKQGEKSFTTLEADSNSSGFYSADFLVDIAFEPTWDYNVSRSGPGYSTKDSSSTYESEERYNASQGYEYYISIKENDITRSGEVLNLDLRDLTQRLFSHLSVGVHINKNIYVTLNEIKYNKDTTYRVKKAYIEARKGSNVVANRELLTQFETIEYDVLYEATLEPDGEYDSLYLVVTYSNDLTVEKRLEFY